jgi:hypothetical protein
MKKRGQIHAQVIKYALIALFIIAIQLVGYRSFVLIKEKHCQTELVKFQLDLKGLDRGIGFRDVEERTYRVPCGADKIYFLDLGKDIPLGIFDGVPAIKGSLNDEVQHNIFVVKEKAILDSFYAGNLEFAYPYHTCLKPHSGRINFFIEGRGNKATIIPGCMQAECTAIPINISEEEARTILAEFIGFGCELCPSNIDSEVENFKTQIEKVKLFRRIKYCPTTGMTDIEIIIKPKKGVTLKNFRFFEVIPKNCIDDLKKYLAETIHGDFKVFIRNDPLIMWQFGEINRETVIGYKLKAELSEACKEAVKGIGIAELIVGGGKEAGPPVISNFPLIQFNENTQYTLNLNDYASDPDNIRWELEWSASGYNRINIEIKKSLFDLLLGKSRAIFTPQANWNGQEEVIFTVTDPDGLSDSVKTIVEVLPAGGFCGNGICEVGECPSGCADCGVAECCGTALSGGCDSSVGETISNCPTDCGGTTYTFSDPTVIMCEEIKYAPCQYNCKAGDCALEFGADWDDIGCGCCGIEVPFVGCVGKVKPKCRKRWQTTCGITLTCGAGAMVGGTAQDCHT